MNKTAKSFGIVTSFSVATRLASFIFKMWMSRSLGAEIVGLYQIALSTLLMLSPQAHRQCSRARLRKQAETSKNKIRLQLLR